MVSKLQSSKNLTGAEIRVKGLVQGVGFRPAVWRWATELGLSGKVRNDGDGLLIIVAGTSAALDELCRRLTAQPPRLARVDSIERSMRRRSLPTAGFRIASSHRGPARTSIAPDAAICEACRAEIADPSQRRLGYALTNCTDCGPRLSIIEAVPYDRARTTMAGFAMCEPCRSEYENSADRRFHAEPIACPSCGPQVHLLPLPVSGPAGTHPQKGAEAIAEAARMIEAGSCIAIKGIGGYQLACDATNAAAIVRLRAVKRRKSKPFALMARDLEVIGRYARISTLEAEALASREAPIVLLDSRPGLLPAEIAPGLGRLGFMLPATPLHVLLLKDFDKPLVLTSGNISETPQIIDDAEAQEMLSGIASHVLAHDRPIAMRLDDSVVQVAAGSLRVLRRARGYVPAAIPMPPGFETVPEILAFGAEQKSTFCLLRNGCALLSAHQGDLEDAATLEDYRHSIERFTELFDVSPALLACDLHPDYFSTNEALSRTASAGNALARIQHHHAHIASCLAENGYPLNASPVLGIALDGLGLGDDGTLWGGELLIADYVDYRRVGRLKPVAMPGGAAAIREPWRSLYAHLDANLGWANVHAGYEQLPAIQSLAGRALPVIDRMIASGLNAPPASSCARLFDAVAAVCGLAADWAGYEGEAAMQLEALVAISGGDAEPYPFASADRPHLRLLELDPAPMWSAILDDLSRGVGVPLIAARFHAGLAAALFGMVIRVLHQENRAGMAPSAVALSGGVFQNRTLLEGLTSRLSKAGIQVLNHAKVPANDGGLSLGQAMVAAARAIRDRK